jgi:hypothetical protein
MDEPPVTIEGTALAAESAALQWWEAVAVILQLAETIVEQAAAAGVPDLPHLRLSTDGTIAILSGSERSDQPVTRLADTLKLLLQNAATPPELARFVTETSERAPAVQDQDVGHFATSLRYFERPDRQRTLHALVERIATAETQAHILRELERLRVKAREAAMAHAAPKSEPSPESRRRWTRMIVALVVVVVVAGGGAVAWFMYRPALTKAGSDVTSVVTQASKGVSQAFTKGVDRLFGTGGQEPAPTPATEAPSAPKPAARARTRPGTAPEAQPDAAGQQADSHIPLVAPLPPTAPASPEPVAPVAPVPPAAAAEPDLEPERIYTSADADVTPPVPQQPLLGRPTNDVLAVPGDVDIVIDRTGAVERVVLLLPNRFQDRMLVYAIKARKFAPAIVNGHPVRYRLRIRMGS